MSLVFVASLMVMASGAPSAESQDAAGQSPAAYAQMAAGQTSDAIALLEAERVRHPDDPALLINLGTAYFRANRLTEARVAFTQALGSERRYSVELADGSWEDSRNVARRALGWLDRSVLAAR